MNGFSEHELSEESFGAAKGGLSSFDAFRKLYKALYVGDGAVGRSIA